MQLVPPKLEKRFKEVGSQENSEEVLIIAKYFHPLSTYTWYATEYYPDRKEFFGYVAGDYGERGYFSLEELERLCIRGLYVERDLYREEIPATTLFDNNKN